MMQTPDPRLAGLWLIEPTRLAAAIAGGTKACDGCNDQPGDMGEPTTAPMQIANGVAVVDVCGVIVQDCTWIEAYFGGVCDVRDVAAQLSKALAAPDVGAILLRINSPGGTVGGVAELADMIAAANAQKPVLAFTDSLCASAALWVASASYMFAASRMSSVGSVGCYLVNYDVSKMFEMLGVKADLIASKASPYKGAGAQGTSLTDDQRADLQAGVDYVYDQFSAFLTSRRKVDPAALDGRVFFGAEAKALGLVDAVATEAEVMADAVALARVRGIGSI